MARLEWERNPLLTFGGGRIFGDFGDHVEKRGRMGVARSHLLLLVVYPSIVMGSLKNGCISNRIVAFLSHDYGRKSMCKCCTMEQPRVERDKEA